MFKLFQCFNVFICTTLGPLIRWEGGIKMPEINKNNKLVTENIIYEMLENSRSIAKAKSHDLLFITTRHRKLSSIHHLARSNPNIRFLEGPVSHILCHHHTSETRGSGYQLHTVFCSMAGNNCKGSIGACRGDAWTVLKVFRGKISEAS